MHKDEFTNQELFVTVGDGHKLKVWDWGNPRAKTPFIVLHGGPGGRAKDKAKQLFDPTKHRVIFFDQRGCGESTSYGSIENNTTDKMIADITKIADHFKIKKFYLEGGSWGSCLALDYAIANPKRVAGLFITGIFTGTASENNWMSDGRIEPFFPDVYKTFIEQTPEKHRDDPAAYHFDKVINGSADGQKRSGYIYSNLEHALLSLDDRFEPEPYEDFDPSGIRIEMYYTVNNFFMPENYILDNAHKIEAPVHIVQGRYDMCCPPITAWKLHNVLPNSQLHWAISGHRGEHEVVSLLQAAMAECC